MSEKINLDDFNINKNNTRLKKELKCMIKYYKEFIKKLK